MIKRFKQEDHITGVLRAHQSKIEPPEPLSALRERIKTASEAEKWDLRWEIVRRGVQINWRPK